ncbi:MAG: hypothetical protein A2089_03725 [Elusimicrobia bacterium GWD2_63_28]|nr:MAG: hypothetical protein A2089_03725 [Elusimicrobia bacterium GWD2_63_28]
MLMNSSVTDSTDTRTSIMRHFLMSIFGDFRKKGILSYIGLALSPRLQTGLAIGQRMTMPRRAKLF